MKLLCLSAPDLRSDAVVAAIDQNLYPDDMIMEPEAARGQCFYIGVRGLFRSAHSLKIRFLIQTILDFTHYDSQLFNF